MNKQELAFEKLSKLKVGALFMEMGTGKTKVALDLIASKKDKVNYILWICPFSIKNEIKSEIAKWHPELDIEIVGVETLSLSGTKYLDVLTKAQLYKMFIVVDESLKIKNINSQRTKRIIELGKYAQYKLLLNGTPLSKNVLDLYPQLTFLSPKILNMSYVEFKNKYCEYYIRGKLKNKVKKQYNIEHLISLIRPYIFDCELDLNKGKTYKSYEYTMSDINTYEQIKQRFLFYNNDIAFFALANALQHHYCSDQAKFTLLNNLINSIDGQVIVFVKFLDSIPEGAKSIVGSMKPVERNRTIADFKMKKIKTLYITYGCGSFGLNLQNCHNMIFADHTFDYAERLQAEARIFRLGQEQDVTYYSLNCTCGLDRLIRACLNKKVRLLDEVKRTIEQKGVEKWVKSI